VVVSRTLTRLLPFLLLAVSSPTAVERQTSGSQLPRFVFENGSRSDASISSEGIIRLTSSRGWLRTARIFSDFTFSADFMVENGQTDAGIGIRTSNVEGEWPQRGYRIQLGEPVGEWQARGYRLTRHDHAQRHSLPPGTWHRVTISAIGPRVTVSLNGRETGRVDIETLAGAVLLDARKGAVRFRNVAIMPLPGSTILRSTDYAGDPKFEAPKLVKSSPPAYPSQALNQGTDGLVTLEVVILVNGTVGATISTHAAAREFQRAAIAAVRQWKFAPGSLEGRPVPVILEIEVSFRVGDPP
jgi:TonB family protein